MNDIELFELGKKFENERNYTESVKYYHEAAKLGNVDAQLSLGFCYDLGRGVEVNKKEAVKWYILSASKNNKYALANLANILYDVKDYEEAVKWYRKSADLGLDYAQYRMGLSYQFGRGVPKDDAEAAKWFRLAAEQGDVSAQVCLGNCYREGCGVTKNYEEAVKWFRKAAEKGDAVAQNNLANRYKRGEGVIRDTSEAFRLYKLSADSGYELAQKNLLILCEAEGKWWDEAVKWYKKFAENGNAEYQYKLGLCYFDGKGVLKDRKTAKYWFKKAADGGHQDARAKLSGLWALFC